MLARGCLPQDKTYLNQTKPPTHMTTFSSTLVKTGLFRPKEQQQTQALYHILIHILFWTKVNAANSFECFILVCLVDFVDKRPERKKIEEKRLSNSDIQLMSGQKTNKETKTKTGDFLDVNCQACPDLLNGILVANFDCREKNIWLDAKPVLSSHMPFYPACDQNSDLLGERLVPLLRGHRQAQCWSHQHCSLRITNAIRRGTKYTQAQRRLHKEFSSRSSNIKNTQPQDFLLFDV